MENYQGQLLDSRYLVGDLIANGGMGVVYRGRHSVIGREVAIKFLNREFTISEEIVARFYREAQTAAAIGHKNVIDILDVGISDRKEPYFVMEYLEGESLAALLERNGFLGLDAACAVFEPVLLAVSAAHAKGVVHRDIKPANIFLVHDVVDDTITIKLIDFGVSKFLNAKENDKLTQAGSTLGTPCYMSPEQVSCAFEVDHRADIYALGVVLFELLTGDTPHPNGGTQETMIKILTEPPRNPSEINPLFPEEARPIIERAMAPNPIHRFASAMEMLHEIRQLSAFQNAKQALIAVARGMVTKQCAVGDLGCAVDSDRGNDVAAGVLSSLSSPYSHASRSSFGLRLSRFITGRENRMFKVLIGCILIGLTGVTFLITGVGNGAWKAQAVPVPLVSFPRTEADPLWVPLREPAAAPPERDEVRIHLFKTPPRSTIFFNDVSVPSNQFRVPVGNTASKLTVEAPGYTSFKAEVIPDKDLLIEVKMLPVRAPPGKAFKTTSAASSESTIRGRRNTEFLTDFE